jgi:ABC-type uncharacterized transport system fused permease/ATPase subunit
MDEPTSSLDELSQFKLMEYMRDLLVETTVIHAGHRAGLEPFHDRKIRLVRVRDWAGTAHGTNPTTEAAAVEAASQELPHQVG